MSQAIFVQPCAPGKEKAQRRSAVTRNVLGGADFYVQQPSTCFAFVADALTAPPSCTLITKYKSDKPVLCNFLLQALCPVVLSQTSTIKLLNNNLCTPPKRREMLSRFQEQFIQGTHKANIVGTIYQVNSGAQSKEHYYQNHLLQWWFLTDQHCQQDSFH